MNLFSFLSEPLPVALGWTLLHALWQGFALVLPAALLLYVLRRRAGLVRYRVAVLTLFCQIIASAVTFALYYRPGRLLAQLVPATQTNNSVRRVWLTALAETPASWQQTVQHWLNAHLADVVLLWLAGVTVFGVRLVGGWLFVNRLKTTATKPANAALTQTLHRLAGQLNLRPAVQIRESARVAVPVVVGILKPVVLLPIGLVAGLSIAEVEAILAHELAHVRRNDFIINLLQSVIEVLYFFHPALWWLSARVREERENCCDDLALTVCADGRTLARALACVEEFRLARLTPTPALAMAFSSPKKQLLHRVRRVLGVSVRPAVSNGSLAGLTLATLLVLAVSAVAVAQEQKAKQPKPKAKATRPVAMRRFSVSADTEFGTSNDNRLSYVVWHGQRLPAKSVARLQRELDGSLSGKVSLDNVPQPDRDILLTIIEKTNSFENGMNGLATGLSNINYDNIVADAMASVKDLDLAKISADAMESVKDLDLAKISADALASVHLVDSVRLSTGDMKISIDTNIVINSMVNVNDDQIFFNDNGIARAGNRDMAMRVNNRKLDSLNRLMALQNRQSEALRLQMEGVQFQAEQLERQQELLNWKKNRLSDARQRLLDAQRELMNNPAKKLTEADVEKQVAELEQQITAQEKGITALNKSLEEQNAKLREARQPLEKLEAELEKIEGQNSRLSDDMSRYSDAMSRYGDAMGRYGDAQNRLNRLVLPPMPPRPAMRRMLRVRPPFPPKPALAPRPAVAPNPVAAPKAPAKP